MMSLARRCSVADFATLLCSMIRSSRPGSITSPSAAEPAARATSIVMRSFLPFHTHLLELLGIVQDLGHQVFKLLVTGQLVAQFGQLGTRFEQASQRLDLACNGFRSKIFDRFENQFDTK